MANLGELKPQPKISERRNWRNYSKTGLIEIMKEVSFDLEITTVQELYNDIEKESNDPTHQHVKLQSGKKPLGQQIPLT